MLPVLANFLVGTAGFFSFYSFLVKEKKCFSSFFFHFYKIVLTLFSGISNQEFHIHGKNKRLKKPTTNETKVRNVNS